MLKSAPQKYSNLKVFNATNFKEVTLDTSNVAIVFSCKDHCLFSSKDAWISLINSWNAKLICVKPCPVVINALKSSVFYFWLPFSMSCTISMSPVGLLTSSFKWIIFWCIKWWSDFKMMVWFSPVSMQLTLPSIYEQVGLWTCLISNLIFYLLL